MTIVIFALASMQGLISHFELEIDRHGASGLQFGELFFEALTCALRNPVRSASDSPGC